LVSHNQLINCKVAKISQPGLSLIPIFSKLYAHLLQPFFCVFSFPLAMHHGHAYESSDFGLLVRSFCYEMVVCVASIYVYNLCREGFIYTTIPLQCVGVVVTDA